MKHSNSVTDRQTLTLEELAILLGIGRSTAYQLAAEDQLPVPVIRVGRRVVVPRRAVEALLSYGPQGRIGEGQSEEQQSKDRFECHSWFYYRCGEARAARSHETANRRIPHERSARCVNGFDPCSCG